MNKNQIQRLVNELGKRVDFHRNNTNDPHNIGVAVMVALEEVRTAIVDAVNGGEEEE